MKFKFLNSLSILGIEFRELSAPTHEETFLLPIIFVKASRLLDAGNAWTPSKLSTDKPAWDDDNEEEENCDDDDEAALCKQAHMLSMQFENS